MDLAQFREYCLSKPCATEGMPFGPDVLVFKVSGKMFAFDSDTLARIVGRITFLNRMDASLVEELISAKSKPSKYRNGFGASV